MPRAPSPVPPSPQRVSECALRPHGTIVIHEYIDYRSWRVSPQSDELDEFVAAVMRSWRASGGEPDIGRDLPRWAEELGFEIQSMLPIVDIIRPRDFAWQWPIPFMRSGLRRLLDLGDISAERGEAIASAFSAIERDTQAIMVTPAVLEVIASRR